MDGLTRSSSRANTRARVAVVLGLLGLVVMPAAVVVSREVERVSLLDAGASVPVAGLLGLGAILLGRRARQQVQRTIGRIGEERLALLGRALGMLVVCLAFTAALALGFFGLLTLFAS